MDREADKRYLLMRSRLSQLSIDQIRRIVNNIDSVCFDQYNYDGLNKKFCPLAIALNLDGRLENPNDELVREYISHSFYPVNILKGLDGEFYRENRKDDLMSLCSELIEEKVL